MKIAEHFARISICESKHYVYKILLGWFIALRHYPLRLFVNFIAVLDSRLNFDFISNFFRSTRVGRVYVSMCALYVLCIIFVKQNRVHFFLRHLFPLHQSKR
jgi:hypothetical protein